MKRHRQSTESSRWHAILVCWLLLLSPLCNEGKQCPKGSQGSKGEDGSYRTKMTLSRRCEGEALSRLLLSQDSCRETDTTAEADLVPASRRAPSQGEAGME